MCDLRTLLHYNSFQGTVLTIEISEIYVYVQWI